MEGDDLSCLTSGPIKVYPADKLSRHDPRNKDLDRYIRVQRNMTEKNVVKRTSVECCFDVSGCGKTIKVSKCPSP